MLSDFRFRALAAAVAGALALTGGLGAAGAARYGDTDAESTSQHDDDPYGLADEFEDTAVEDDPVSDEAATEDDAVADDDPVVEEDTAGDDEGPAEEMPSAVDADERSDDESRSADDDAAADDAEFTVVSEAAPKDRPERNHPASGRNSKSKSFQHQLDHCDNKEASKKERFEDKPHQWEKTEWQANKCRDHFQAKQAQFDDRR